ncbi:cell growth regulator with EF hand domain protein 1 [Myiozetetes cayanensis]|uniref:cell growth regulator with EF hand domain protein 1 n=1 Tax=Myiozetetes cayanensis TaxID=478635 RepID=UPI00215DFC92|nr:cell growth regulator with EF hand domain protein 1 [Myiozetetes cayanensis]
MRNPPVTLTLLLLLLLEPAARAAPRAGAHRPEPPPTTIPEAYPDPLSPESLPLPLLRGAVRSLGLPEQDVEAMPWEQALLYLIVLHDHDRSGHLDGLELLQLLGTVLAQAGGRPDPDMMAALVDRALVRQDRNGDGLLDPHELLSPDWGQGPPGQPPLEPQTGAGAVPEEGTEMLRGHLGVSGPGQAVPETGATQAGAPEDGGTEGDEAPKVESPSAEAVEAEEAPKAEAHNSDTSEEEETPEAEALEGDEAPKVESPNAEAVEAEEAPEAEAHNSDASEEEETSEAEALEGEEAPAWRDSEEG